MEPSLVGTPTRLIKETQAWEGKLIEAPIVWKHGSKYYFLFYSANDYHSCNYAVGYAVASSVLGPYVKPLSHPWLSSANGVCGPGGEDIVAGKKRRSLDGLPLLGGQPVLPQHEP